MMRKIASILLFIILLWFLIFSTLFAQTKNRFPKPEFESGYIQPQTTTPAPREAALEAIDVAVLVVTLGLASYFALKTRSRRALFFLTIFSLVYFGFYRKGCVCSVGAIQNMVFALVDSTYAIPVTVLLFFILPLVFALFFGRTFCAAVCPLGAIQELIILRPMKISAWLAQTLGIIPYVYLGLTILFAATGSAFVICRLDPFVGFFRFGASFDMLLLGACFLLMGLFIARPYCRFLCPYGVLLGWMSRFSKWHVTITPDDCIQCRLCEESCPFGAIQTPAPKVVPESHRLSKRRLAILIGLLPVLILVGGWIGANLDTPLSRLHPTIRLAEQVISEDIGKTNETTEESRTFRSTGTPSTELFNAALSVREQFETGGRLLGGFLGLMFGLKLVSLSIRRTRKDYEPDRTTCFSCARCFSYCPQEHLRLKKS